MKIKFKNFNEFHAFLPEDELKITMMLTDIIEECLPLATKKLTYNVPHYYLNNAVCFLWPGSVLWGNKRTYKGVRMGFSKGHLLQEETNYFKLDNRKYVSFHDFISTEEVDMDIDIVKMYLFSAAALDLKLSKS